MAKDGDIPVQIPPVAGEGKEAKLTITAGDQKLAVRTGGKNLRITVKSGKTTFSVPVDKTDWHLTIELDK
jgi:hypothetical protein